MTVREVHPRAQRCHCLSFIGDAMRHAALRDSYVLRPHHDGDSLTADLLILVDDAHALQSHQSTVRI